MMKTIANAFRNKIIEVFLKLVYFICFGKGIKNQALSLRYFYLSSNLIIKDAENNLSIF